MENYFPVLTFPNIYWPDRWWTEVGTSTGITVSNSIRWQISNAIQNALASSTGISSVSDKLEPWWDFDHNQFPHVFVKETNEQRERFTFLDSTGLDMHARLDFTVTGYCFDINNDFDSKRSDLVRDIEIAIQTSTAIKDVVWEIIPQDVVSDQGMLDNYCIVHCHYQARYLYNHLAA
jgi:hypothetical protein